MLFLVIILMNYHLSFTFILINNFSFIFNYYLLIILILIIFPKLLRIILRINIIYHLLLQITYGLILKFI